MTTPPILPNIPFTAPADPDLRISGPAEMIDVWLRGLGWLPSGEIPSADSPAVMPAQTLNLLMRTIDGTTYVHLRTDEPVPIPDGADLVGVQMSQVILGSYAGNFHAVAPMIAGTV